MLLRGELLKLLRQCDVAIKAAQEVFDAAAEAEDDPELKYQMIGRLIALSAARDAIRSALSRERTQ